MHPQKLISKTCKYNLASWLYRHGEMGNYTSHKSNHLSRPNRHPYSQLRCYEFSPFLPIPYWKNPCNSFLAVIKVYVDLFADAFFYCYQKKCPVEIQCRMTHKFLPKTRWTHQWILGKFCSLWRWKFHINLPFMMLPLNWQILLHHTDYFQYDLLLY